MRSVRHLLEAKAPEVHSIGPDAPVIDAIRLMAEKHIGALVVIDAGRLAGMVSERDYARKIVLQGRSSSTHRRIRHLPVVVDGAVVGLVSIGDLVKAVIEDQQLELDQLQRYIAS